MRIIYLSVSYLPSRSASSVHVMKMCAALARCGHEVELVSKLAPARQEDGVEDDHSFYGVPNEFRITKLPRPEWKGGGLVYLHHVNRLLHNRELDLVYSRDLVSAWLATHRRLGVLYEAHGLPSGRLAGLIARRLVKSDHLLRLVTISQALADLWRERSLVVEDRLTVAHDACDPMEEAAEPRAEDPRSALRIGYVGHLYPGRGVDLIVELARRLPEMAFHLVGGSERDLEAWRGRGAPSNCSFHGFVPPRELPTLYRQFDVLLMPYQRKVGVRSGKSDTAAWMSPMKMFEYLAAGRPIVSSELPVLREVLQDKENALLVPPDDANAWEKALRQLADDVDLRRRLAANGLRDFRENYTWSSRAARVLLGLPPSGSRAEPTVSTATRQDET